MRYAVIDLDMLEYMLDDAKKANDNHIENTGQYSEFHQGRWLAYQYVYQEMMVAEL